LRGARPSSGFGPASEFDPRSVAPVLADAGTLTRFLAPTTLPTRRDPPLPSFSCPGHVTPSHLPCASAPFSLGGLPGVLSTRCAHGTDPSELLPSEICATFQQRFPSCDWRPTASADTRPAYSAPHEIGRPKGWFLGRTTEGPSLSLQRCFVRFRRIGISARAASLQGFAPSHRLGPPPPDFSACGTLCSLGFHPPWGAPLPRLGLSGCRGSFFKVHNTPAPARSLSQARSASSRHFRAPPV
jgi:hypothetical protein